MEYIIFWSCFAAGALYFSKKPNNKMLYKQMFNLQKAFILMSNQYLLPIY